MKALAYLIVTAMIGMSAALADEARTQAPPSGVLRVESEIRESARELNRQANQSLTFPEERKTYADAARIAWIYADRYYSPQTGLFNATSGYPYTTVWDIASGLAVLYAGRELGFLDSTEYDRRMRRALGTLKAVDLFESAAFNKIYSTSSGSMIGRDHRPSNRGFGWSAIDIGRLLVWLKILAVKQPEYNADAEAIVRRLAMERLVHNGYLWGEDLDPAGKTRLYQEGQLGYEQYAARGFSLWGLEPEKAMRLRENSLPINVLGRPLLTDVRGGEYLTSDPFTLTGLELGWDQETEQLAVQMLAVQEARFKKTGRVTLVAEDAVSQPPYFFYYCVYRHNLDFEVGAFNAGSRQEGPRWISAKAAFAWHALLPSQYTELALRKVAPARTPNGWSSGVYEVSGASTGSLNINTAAVILEAVLVHTRGESLLNPGLQAD
jgi:hypothetical protein